MGCQQLVFSDTKQNPTRKQSKEILNATTWLFFKKNIHSISKTIHISLHCRSHIGPFQVRKSHNFSSESKHPNWTVPHLRTNAWENFADFLQQNPGVDFFLSKSPILSLETRDLGAIKNRQVYNLKKNSR